jgi:predicted component of viral defense system (DUF524 family)
MSLLSLTLSGGFGLIIDGSSNRRTVPSNVSSSVVLELGPGVSATMNVGTIQVAAAGRIAVPPLLFEQSRYDVEVVQPDIPDSVPVSLLIAGKDLLRARHRRGHAMTTINFESEIGYSRWELRQEGRLIAALRLEVFPSKLDYQTDYFALRASLESEVRMLAGALSGRTWQPRGRKRTTEQSTDLEWLIQLCGIFDEWVQALECIDRHPRRRLVREMQLRPMAQVRRADQTALNYLRRHPNQLSRTPSGPLRIGTERWTAARLPDSRRTLDLKTPENLFVAYAFQRVSARIRGIRARLDAEKSGAKGWCDFLDEASTKLRRMEARTFLSEIDSPLHAPGITLAMHLAPGYREFLRTWNLLQASLTLDGEALELSEKNVATLYELWCFVALGNLLRKELGAKPKRPDWLVIDQRGVALGLRKGGASELVMDTPRHGRIRVAYNQSDRTPTGDCRPDNTLEIAQSGLTKRSFRYVFDAKYRLCDDDDYLKSNGAPGVPTDVITKMHAYRDQIVTDALQEGVADPAAVIWDMGQRRYQQQTVGAFALFPYSGADAEKNRYFISIAKVGVGALPFLPSRRSEVEALVRRIVATTAETVEDTAVELSSVAEVARIIKSHEYGLLGIVKNQAQLDYALRERVYHMPYRSKQLRLRADFVILIISESQAKYDHGAVYHAKVRSVNFGTRGSITPIPPGDESMKRTSEPYVWFETDAWEKVTPVLSYQGHPPHFGFTTRLAFESASDVADLLLVREPERRLANELRAAGATVRAFDETSTTASPFDLASLRLRVKALWPDAKQEVEVRFNPAAGEFRWAGESATWKELMFSPAEVISRIRAVAAER